MFQRQHLSLRTGSKSLTQLGGGGESRAEAIWGYETMERKKEKSHEVWKEKSWGSCP